VAGENATAFITRESGMAGNKIRSRVPKDLVELTFEGTIVDSLQIGL
jgi:hypothetical protein